MFNIKKAGLFDKVYTPDNIDVIEKAEKGGLRNRSKILRRLPVVASKDINSFRNT